MLARYVRRSTNYVRTRMSKIEILAPSEQEGSKTVVSVWHKSVGDRVQEGEPLLDLETDKVVVEVSAPASGKLAEILLVSENVVQPGEILGRIDVSANEVGAVVQTAFAGYDAPDESGDNVRAPASNISGSEPRLSAAVRQLLSENNLRREDIVASGANGRLTLRDVQHFLKSRSESSADTNPESSVISRIPHTMMRRRIADHMVRSVATAPHVTAIVEADFSGILEHQRAFRERSIEGAKPTLTSYVIAAAVQAMKVEPAVNSRWTEEFLEVYADVNIGVGTALDGGGLIVPVLKQAQTLGIEEIAAGVHDLVSRARRGNLKPHEVDGGTFTVSNHGVSGSLVAAPIIINQPQSAILGVGKLQKRAVVRATGGNDSVGILPMAYVSLTIDHRVLDGQQANHWLSRFVDVLESWAP